MSYSDYDENWPIFDTRLHPPTIFKEEIKESKKRHDESTINRWYYCKLSFTYWIRKFKKLKIVNYTDISDTRTTNVYLVTFSNIKNKIPKNVTSISDNDDIKRHITDITLSKKGKWDFYIIFPSDIMMLKRRYTRARECYSVKFDLNKFGDYCDDNDDGYEFDMKSDEIESLVIKSYCYEYNNHDDNEDEKNKK